MALMMVDAGMMKLVGWEEARRTALVTVICPCYASFEPKAVMVGTMSII